MFEGDSKGGNDHRLADIWSAGVCFYCMTECRFPFTVGNNGGAGGHDVHETSTQYLRIMEQIMKSEWRLKDGRPAVSCPCPTVIWIDAPPLTRMGTCLLCCVELQVVS